MSTSHAQALERFKLGTDAIQKQVKREIDDLQFQIPEPEFQWSAEARTMRAGSTGGNVATPAKPMLCIPKLDQPIQLVLNQEKAAHLGVQIHALSEDAEDDTAEVMQGIYRRIEVDSRAGLARSWAYERAVKCGRGAYRVLTEMDPGGGHPSDQKIVIKRILYQESAIFDPFAEEPDWSDGRWAFVTSWIPWDRYKARYDKSALAGYGEDELADALNDCPEWMTGEGEGRAVLVAEYFCLTESEDGPPKLTWSLMNGIEVLKTQEMDGRYIPIVPVIGREIVPFGQERRWQGIISSNKDGARMFNYAASQAVTVAALEPLAPFQLDPRQIEGYETWWAQANTKQFPYLPSLRDPNKGWETPVRTQVDAGRLGPSMMLIQQADSFLHAGTGAFEAALGQGSPQNKTKGGILALQQQQEQGNSHFLDNLAEISITYEAKVILDLMPYVYDRPGRVVRTLDLEDNTKTVMLNQPFVKGPNGRPMAAPPQMPGQAPQQGMVGPQQPQQPGAVLGLQQQPSQPKVLHFNLKKGMYGVVVKVGKAYDSRVAEGSDALSSIMQAAPGLMPAIGPVWAKFQQWPGHQEVAKTLKKMRDHDMPWLADDDDQAQQAEQMIPQLKAQLQAQGEQLKQAAQIIQTKQVENAAKVQIAQSKDAVTLQKTQMDNETKIAVAELGAKVDRLALFMEERARLGVQTHDEGLAGAQAAHELQMQAEAHQQSMAQGQQAAGNQAALAAQGQAHALEQGDQSQQNTLEAQQQAAALAPEPASGE